MRSSIGGGSTRQKELSRGNLKLLLYRGNEMVVRESCSRRRSIRRTGVFLPPGSLFPEKDILRVFLRYPKNRKHYAQCYREGIRCRKLPSTIVEGNAGEERKRKRESYYRRDSLKNAERLFKFEQIGSMCNFKERYRYISSI